jgi:hypothetical protein
MGTTTRTIDRRQCDLCGEVEDVTRGPMGRMRGRWFSAEFEDLKGSPGSEEEREHWPRDYAPPGGEKTGPWLPLILCGTCCTMAIAQLKRLRADRTEQRHRRQLTNISAQYLEESGLGRSAFPSVPVSYGTGKTVNEEVAAVHGALAFPYVPVDQVKVDAMAAEALRVGGALHFDFNDDSVEVSVRVDPEEIGEPA